jgi:hypothetical protein
MVFTMQIYAKTAKLLLVVILLVLAMHRSIDAEDHEQDIQQPYGKDGKPNPMFIRLYPKQAKAVFTEKQMRDANR